MKTWKNFLAEKHTIDSNKVADEEESSGIDVDHDEEKGEPAAHKACQSRHYKQNVEFFDKRKSGAAKIASQSEEKGPGPSELTAWHFEAKAKPYKEVLDGISSGKPEAWFIKKRDMAMEKVHASLNNQKAFQESVGVLEVWGETVIQLFHH